MRGICFLMLFLSSFSLMAKDTELNYYRPYSQPEMVVSQKVKGHCDEESLLSQREDAWVCQAEGKVYEPCFAKTQRGARSVLCPASPWQKEAVEIKSAESLDGSLHSSIDMSRGYPWAVELENGLRCLGVRSSERFDNLRVHYHCSDGSQLLGHIQRCSPEWKMLRKSGKQINTILLTRVWF